MEKKEEPKKRKIRLKFIDSDIAYTMNDEKGKCIFINKDLKKYPKLYKRVLAHEIGHFRSEKQLDLWHDIKEVLFFTTDKQMLEFVVSNPSTWSSLLPITIKKKGGNTVIAINWFLLLSFLGFLAIYLILLSIIF